MLSHKQQYLFQGYKIILTEHPTSLQLEAINLETGQFFANDLVILLKINSKALKAALIKQSKQISICITMSEKQLRLNLTVDMELIPKFEQSIRLQEQEAKAGDKLALSQMSEQITELNTLVDSIIQGKSYYHKEISSLSVNSKNNIWLRTLPKGTYLMQISATVTLSGDEYNENGQYDDYSGLQNHTGKLQITTSVSSSQKIVHQDISNYNISSFQIGYENLFSCCSLVKCESESVIDVNMCQVILSKNYSVSLQNLEITFMPAQLTETS